MGEKKAANITHIAIFARAEGNTIYFIDSTEKSAEGKAPSVNGVTERSYSRNDKRFKSGGIMLLKHLKDIRVFVKYLVKHYLNGQFFLQMRHLPS